jgi:hypothetical protein
VTKAPLPPASRRAGWVRWAIDAAVFVLLLEATVRVGLALGDPFVHRGHRFTARWPPLSHTCPAAGQEAFRHDRALGWVPAPGRHAWLGVEVENTAAGTRRLPAAVEGASGPVVVLLGDSNVYGDEVPDHATWANVLQAERPDLRVHNLGVSGYGFEQALLRWRAHGAALHPSVVVVGVHADDVLRDGTAWHMRPKPWLDDALAVRGVPVPTAAEVCATLRLRPWSWAVLRRLRDGLRLPRDPAAFDPETPAERHATRVLDALAREVAAAGARLVVVRPSPHATEDLPPRPWARAWVAEHDLVVVPVARALAASRREGGEELAGGHLAPARHAAVGRAVAETLESLLPAPTAP